jgi:autoinducer 2 (AI-2) kinase
MERGAEKVPPGSNGAVAIMLDIMNVKKLLFASPAFTQFDLMAPQQSGKKKFIRALEENAAYATKGSYEVIWEVIVFCGGAAKGFLWPQIVSEVLGIPLCIPTIKEVTALGAAICAGVGVKIYRDIATTSASLVK